MRNNYVRLYDVISHDVMNLPKTHYRMARLICNYYIIESIPPINSLLDGVGRYHKSDAFRSLKHDLNLVFVRKSYGHVE